MESLKLKIPNFKRKIQLWNNTSINVLVQRIVFYGTLSMYVAGFEKLMTTEAIHITHQNIESAAIYA